MQRHTTTRRTRFLGAALALLLPALAAPAQPAALTLHDALESVRAGKASDPRVAAALERLTAQGTPVYVYDQETLERQARALSATFSARFPKLRVFYALKANTNPEVISILRQKGLGAEVVSEGEIRLARKLGVPAGEILFTSSSKNPAELKLAVDEGTIVNVDSLDELEQLEGVAAKAGKLVSVSFRINPGVDPHTIHQINTGISESKFGLHLEEGIAFSAYARAQKLPHLKIVGAHCHIGSQITETTGYEETARKMLRFLVELKEKLGVRVEWLDLGGGLGIPYHDGETVMGPDDLAKALKPIWDEGVARLGYEPALWLEPGRFFVAQSGFLLTRVNSVKKTPVKTFVNVDAGFNTLMRPVMYQAYHRARVIGREGEPVKLDVAGDVCETGDILAAERMLPLPKAGDLVAILDAGAYGFSMASEYNARPLPAELLVSGNTFRTIRRRGTFEDLLRQCVTPAPVK